MEYTTGREKKGKRKLKEVFEIAGFVQDQLPCTHTDTRVYAIP